MPKVTFYSAVDASKVTKPTNVISIGSHGDLIGFACEHKRVIRIEFDDCDGFVGSDGLTVFNHEMAERIRKFIDSCDGEDILVHCQAGMSRSAAIAKFINDKRGYDLDLSHPCIGTIAYYNRHAYTAMDYDSAESLRRYYADLELADRQKI